VTIAEEQPSRWLHRWVWVLFDGAIWFAAIYGATGLRFNFTNTDVLVDHTLLFACAAAGAHFVLGGLIGPYAVGHRRGSFDETTDLAVTALATTGGLLVRAFLANPQIVPAAFRLSLGPSHWSACSPFASLSAAIAVVMRQPVRTNGASSCSSPAPATPAASCYAT